MTSYEYTFSLRPVKGGKGEVVNYNKILDDLADVVSSQEITDKIVFKRALYLLLMWTFPNEMLDDATAASKEYNRVSGLLDTRLDAVLKLVNGFQLVITLGGEDYVFSWLIDNQSA